MDGVIQIQPGDRIPLIPLHMFKAFADAQITRKLSADLDFIAVSSSYARGNENNLSQPDGIYYLGPGTAPGYGVVNLGARYELQKHLQIFVQINNLLDHHYYTAAQIAATGFTNQGTSHGLFRRWMGIIRSYMPRSMRREPHLGYGVVCGSASEHMPLWSASSEMDGLVLSARNSTSGDKSMFSHS